MTNAPVVSVLLITYNRERVVADAIRSVLGQSYPDFELIIVDDGSTDTTVDLVSSFGDRRIRVVRLPANQGIPAARNCALDHAVGRYIAWLDSDDVARPNRLAEQLAFLALHSDLAMVGSCAGKIDIDGSRRKGLRIPPFAHEDILAWQLFRSPFQQSSIMGRAEILKRFPYRKSCSVCEDIDVFIRLTRKHRVANIPKVLIDRRLHRDQTVETQKARIGELKKALLKPLLEELGVNPSSLDLEQHLQLGLIKSTPEACPSQYLEWAEGWLSGLVDANERSRLLDRDALRFTAAYFWLRACRRAAATAPAPAPAQALSKLASSKLIKGMFAPHGRAWAAQAFSVSMKAYWSSSSSGSRAE